MSPAYYAPVIAANAAADKVDALFAIEVLIAPCLSLSHKQIFTLLSAPFFTVIGGWCPEVLPSNSGVRQVRGVVQFNLRRNLAFLLDDHSSPFAVNHLFFISVRVINNASNGVCMKKAGLSSILIVVVLLAVGVIAEAQQAEKVFRIGYLGSSVSGPPRAFRQGLQDLGYVESKNIIFEYRTTPVNSARYPDFAAEFVRLRVDVIVGEGAGAIRAAKNASATIPIVMAHVNDPIAAGLVASLAHPGGNITGISNLSPELSVWSYSRRLCRNCIGLLYSLTAQRPCRQVSKKPRPQPSLYTCDFNSLK